MTSQILGWGGLSSGKCGPVDLMGDLLPPLISSHHEQVDLDVGIGRGPTILKRLE